MRDEEHIKADSIKQCSSEIALSMAIEALEPKKVVYDINGLTHLPVSFCPSCGEAVDMYAYGRDDLKQIYCPYCGQALDWKDGGEDGKEN